MDFIGQQSIIENFRCNMAQNALSHAYALTGPAGMGKRTLAHYLAEMMVCADTGKEAPCRRCRACKSFEAGINPQVQVIRSETQNILIKQIRELIDDIGIRPASGRKVYIIEGAERMTPDAQNCFLKTLEEPPPYAVILLTVSNFESLLVTVRSRIVHTRLEPYSIEELAKIGRANGKDLTGKEYLVHWSQGVPGNLLRLLGDTEFEENRKAVMEFVFHDDGFSNLKLNQYLSRKKELFPECMNILESIYRDALLVLCNVEDGLINSDKKNNIIEYAKSHKPIELTEKISKIQEIRSSLKRNMNYQLAVDMVTLEI